jgi:biotin carboxylase
VTGGTMIVLGYRKGLDAAVRARGLDAFHVTEKHKPALDGRPACRVAALEDAQEVLRAVGAAGLADVAGVVTGHEQGVFTAAVLRHHLGLPGDRDFAATLRFRDKHVQKAALPAAIRRARCAYVRRGTTYASLAEALGTPFVVKPANGFGAVSTRVVGSAEELAAMVGDGPPASDVAFVAESFVAGREIHVDGLWEGGRLVWSSVARYHDGPMNAANGGILAGMVVSPAQAPQLVERAQELAAEVLGALDAPDAVFHLEAFVDGDALVFGECAIRVAGAHVPEIVQLTHGVDLFAAQVALALGEPAAPTIGAQDVTDLFGYVYLRRFAGREVTEADFRRRFPVIEIDYPRDPGARAGAYGRVGHAIVADADGERLAERIAAIARFNEHGDG